MKILKVSAKNLKEVFKITTESIRRGEVVILPTDTVYGLIADAKNEKAVKRIFEIKGRETKKTLSIFVKDIKMAKDLAFVNKRQEKFLKTSWPGKVTAVLKAKPKKKKFFKFGIINSENKIGLRIPKYELVNFLIKKLNSPVTGTSANISGNPASTKIKEVLRQFENRKYQPDLTIDAGNLPKSKPSTVFDLTVFPPKILRQ